MVYRQAHMNSPSPTKTARYAVARRVTLHGAIADFVLGITKMVVGYLAHSQALLADGIHSLSDLATDALVVIASRHAAREADDNHPYGHDRFETMASVLLATLLAAVALLITYGAVQRLLAGQPMEIPGVITLVVALGSALVKEGIYHYTMRAARRLDSSLLKANAWHSRTDALSSVVVVAGIAGALLGFPWADAVAAIGVSAMILQVAWSVGHDGARELVDTGLDADELERIRDIVLAVDGVRGMHDLRTRRMGQGVFADLHVHVPSAISVSEGHRISDEVFLAMKQQFPRLADVVVHVDSENDTDHRPSSGLPMRDALEPRVQQMVAEAFGSREAFRRLTLHYLGGKLHLELWLAPTAEAADTAAAAEQLRQRLQGLPQVGGVTLFTELRPPQTA